MQSEEAFVWAVGTDDRGAWITIVCDRDLRVGDFLCLEHDCEDSRLEVRRIEMYDRQFEVLEHGVTGRIWVAPSDGAAGLQRGDVLYVGARDRGSQEKRAETSPE